MMANAKIVTSIVGASVGLLLLGAMLPLLFQGSAATADALNNDSVTTGSEEADSLKPVYATVIGFAAVLVIGSIAFALMPGKTGL